LVGVISSIYVIDIFCEEFERNTIELLLCCVSTWNLVVGKILSALVLSLLLTIFWIGGLIANGIGIDVLPTFASSLSFYLLVISIALLTVVRFRRRAEAQFVFSVIMLPVILPLILLNPSPLTSVIKSSLSIVDTTVLLSVPISLILFFPSLILLRRSLELAFY